MTKHILILGASYGSLLASKLLLAGHDCTLVCRPQTAALINDNGTFVRLPIKGVAPLVTLASRSLRGKLAARPPEEVSLDGVDLVVLAMQEQQYNEPSLRALLKRVGDRRLPCMSIMNMPPLPYMARIPGIDASKLSAAYADASVWSVLPAETVTLCSPDPQAFRPPSERANVLQVRLPTNFKAAQFHSAADTELLKTLAAAIDASRVTLPEHTELLEVPVKLRVHDSLFVPFAKWPMLLAGNYRCIMATGERSIKDAVHGDIAESRAIYEWVAALCRRIGAAEADLVPFDAYAKAAEALVNPSSAARAIAGGATAIERVEKLVQLVAAQVGLTSPTIDDIVATVDARLAANRLRHATPTPQQDKQVKLMAYSEKFQSLADAARAKVEEVAPADVDHLVQQGAIALDIRDKEEHVVDHIPGSLHVSRGKLEMNVEAAIPDRNTTILCYCNAVNRGALSANSLREMGYPNAKFITGGLKGYRGLTLPEVAL